MDHLYIENVKKGTWLVTLFGHLQYKKEFEIMKKEVISECGIEFSSSLDENLVFTVEYSFIKSKQEAIDLAFKATKSRYVHSVTIDSPSENILDSISITTNVINPYD